jgi:hypothetical protein
MPAALPKEIWDIILRKRNGMLVASIVNEALDDRWINRMLHHVSRRMSWSCDGVCMHHRNDMSDSLARGSNMYYHGELVVCGYCMEYDLHLENMDLELIESGCCTFCLRDADYVHERIDMYICEECFTNGPPLKKITDDCYYNDRDGCETILCLPKVGRLNPPQIINLELMRDWVRVWDKIGRADPRLKEITHLAPITAVYEGAQFLADCSAGYVVFAFHYNGSISLTVVFKSWRDYTRFKLPARSLLSIFSYVTLSDHVAFSRAAHKKIPNEILKKIPNEVRNEPYSSQEMVS